MGLTTKQKSSCNAASRRAWRLLRLALLWARKGGILKCRLMSELRHVPKYLKGLNQHKHSPDMIRVGDRELSFDDTPVLHLKMSRPNSLRFMIPCIKPDVVDFEYDFGNDDRDDDYVDLRHWGSGSSGIEKSFLECKGEDYDSELGNEVEERENSNGEQCEEQGIDDKAEEFIANFYQQMKLQRDISFQRRHCNNGAIEVV